MEQTIPSLLEWFPDRRYHNRSAALDWYPGMLICISDRMEKIRKLNSLIWHSRTCFVSQVFRTGLLGRGCSNPTTRVGKNYTQAGLEKFFLLHKVGLLLPNINLVFIPSWYGFYIGYFLSRHTAFTTAEELHLTHKRCSLPLQIISWNEFVIYGYMAGVLYCTE